MLRRILAVSARGSEKKYIPYRKRMFQVELQYDDIKGPTEIDMTRIPEFPASAALQSIEGQNLKGAAFDVLQAYADQARMADMRHEAFYTLAQETGIPVAQLQPMVDLNPDLIGPRPGGPAARSHADLVSHISRRMPVAVQARRSPTRLAQ